MATTCRTQVHSQRHSERVHHITRIPLLNEHRPMLYAILNDPDTGIRLPKRANQSEGKSHIALPTIREQLRNAAVQCVITFDQSTHRETGLNRQSQRNEKLQWLQRERLPAFYYVSHAPFLFAFSEFARMDMALGLIERREYQPIVLRNRNEI
jgi:hypothetical protein